MKTIVKMVNVLVIGAFLLNLGCAKKEEESCNFVQNSSGQRVSWAQLPVRFYVHEDVPKELRDGFVEAAKIWNKSMIDELGFRDDFFVIEDEPTTLGPEKDFVNVLYMEPNWPSNIMNKQALTAVHWTGPRIHEADIVFNASDLKGYELSTSSTVEAGKLDFVSLAVHELGHVAGLGHIHIDGNNQLTVMAEKLPKGKHRREVKPDIELSSLACEY